VEPPILQIRLFGDLELRYGQTLLPAFESSRAASLLAYLLLHRDGPQARQRIAFLLWPDSSEPQARTNLRHLLHTLRGALPESERFIDVTPRTLQWRAGASYWLDAAAFEEAVTRSEAREAVDLYRGDLIEGCYDDWLIDQRDGFRQQYLLALERLVRSLEASGEYLDAIQYACRLQLHDPLYEETYRLLMRLHDARGDRARAVRVYHECATTLERELGVEPSAPTREAYEALLTTQAELPARPEQPAQPNSPLVGRAAEWERLTASWLATERGMAQFVLVSGEPGVGKTRLVEEFRMWCAHRGALTADARSYAAEGALAYGPVVEWLRSDALKSRRNRLERVSLSELARLLPEIRNDLPDLPGPDPVPESNRRQRLFDALARAILAPSVPLLLIIDDVHWSDRETLQFLHYLLRVDPRARLLIAATARREEIDDRHPLNDLITGLHAIERLTEIELERLSREETAELAGRLAGHALAERRADQLYDETEGNPLFVVEALRADWPSGRSAENWMSPKVQAVIESRLAQLSEPARNLVGVAATIGREFTTDILACASRADDESLVRGLDELWRRRVVREQGVDAYDFAHDKLREVAYLALSPARRRHHHLQVAGALEQLHSHDPSRVSGQLAAHYELAGAADKAVNWHVRAAEMAQQLHANIEAVRLLERALHLLETLPETTERQTRELAVLTALPAPLVAVDGYLSSRVSKMHDRALGLTQALGVDPEPPLLRSLALANLSHYEFETAQRFGRQLRAHGEREGDAVLLVQSGYVLGIAAFWRGKLEAARAYFEGAVANSRPEHRRAQFQHYGHDPESTCLIRLACTLWFLGHPEAATGACDAALALAEEIGHPYSRSLTLVFAALLALEMRDPLRLRAFSAELATARADDAPVHVRSTAEVFAGHIDVLDGRVGSGLARIQHILDDPDASEQAPGQEAFFLRVLLESCTLAGDARAGLTTANRLLTKNRGVRLWEAETHRFRAQFLAALGASHEDVEAEINQALETARRQGAKLFELRAAASLLRHHQTTGNDRAVAEVRAALKALVESLPETYDTPDMREAEAALSGS
jgi:DNA-binding SARP family transcriptional activator